MRSWSFTSPEARSDCCRALALVARKGGRAHRIAGVLFVVSMTIMASIGAAVSPFLPIPERANVVAGILTLYFVVSAWGAVRHKHIVPGRLDIVNLIVALTTVAIGALWAVQASYSPTGTWTGRHRNPFTSTSSLAPSRPSAI